MRILSILFTVFLSVPSFADQSLSDELDLANYRVETVYDDWRVICDIAETGSASGYKNCAVEDNFGLVFFLTTVGPIVVTLRGFQPNDALVINATEFVFEECGRWGCPTFLDGTPLEDSLSGAQLRVGGNLRDLRLSGLNEAVEDAMVRVGPN